MTPEQARKLCKTENFDFGDAKLTVRELTRAEVKALNAKLFVTDAEGKPLTYTAEAPDPNGPDWHFQDGRGDADLRREWLLASVTPAELVDEILSDEIPESFKDTLLNTARKLSGLSVRDAAGN